MSKPLLYVTFKSYPELGRLMVVRDIGVNGCFPCALDKHIDACLKSGINCYDDETHLERADERQAKAG